MRKVISVIIILLALLVCLPVLFVISGSLKSGAHYRQLMLYTPEFFVMFWNSVKLTAGILAVQLLAGVPAAWAFAKHRIPWKKGLFTIYMILMMMPFQVTMLSSYLVLERLHLMDNYLAVILPAGFSTFPVFIMYRFFCGVPEVLLDAAKIDGAGMMQVFLHIALPLGSSGVLAAVVLGFLEGWNLIEAPMTFLNTPSQWPLSLYLPGIATEHAGLAFAASVVTIMPAVFVFLMGQDYLEQGICAAAVKE